MKAPVYATPPGQTPLPEGLFLIGCGADAAVAPAPSARSMGFKAWNLLRMAQCGLPVPPAFVLGTLYCADDAARERACRRATWGPGLHALERATGLAFGDARRPLLLSVRSGAPVSMPGMMDTLLDIGLCDATVGGLLRETGNPRLVWDAYRRLVASFGVLVDRVPESVFEQASAAQVGARDERDLGFEELRELTRRQLALYRQHAGRPFPQDPVQQLEGAIGAVLASWQSDRARAWRRLNGAADEPGTAVTLQRMVFGNAGGRSGAGVGFTRDPTDGAPQPWVDFLFNAQGEDVVSGRRNAHGHAELAAVLPEAWQALVEATQRLERAFGDMQDFEFTLQDGRLFLLQTRAGKRTPQAAARIALDLLDEGVIDAAQALERCRGLDRDALARSRLVGDCGVPPLPIGRAASAAPGVAVGEIALDGARAAARHAAGVPVLLLRRDADTDDIEALEHSAGLLTQRGARTSHAAVVARQLGKVCLVGCAELRIDQGARSVTIGTRTLREGELLTLDGNDGRVYAGALRVGIEEPQALLERLRALRERGPELRAATDAAR